jgi:hypothetical protein
MKTFERQQGDSDVYTSMGFNVRDILMNTTMSYRETDDECPSCGATARYRKQNKPSEPQGLWECPYCHTEKCCMCDMGDDVECLSCDLSDDCQTP